MVVQQDELENHCRSRETCAFGTPDAVVCKAARSASAVLAAVGRSVGIAARAGGGFHGAGGKTGGPRSPKKETVFGLSLYDMSTISFAAGLSIGSWSGILPCTLHTAA